jgi:hypothetical protein
VSLIAHGDGVRSGRKFRSRMPGALDVRQLGLWVVIGEKWSIMDVF